MDVGVTAALIAALGSMVVAIVAALFAARGQQQVARLQHRLDRQGKDEDRKVAAKVQLDRYREPLLAAATDLQDRIDNICNRGFLTYLSIADKHRSDIALWGTSYRFARYWAVVEALRKSVNMLKFEREEDTRAVNELLDRIVRTFATDGFEGRTLMVWREEQRAIGELMHSADPQESGIRIIGFSTFVDQHASRFADWLASFEADLQSPGVEKSKRLEELHRLLGQLITELSKGRSLTA